MILCLFQQPHLELWCYAWAVIEKVTVLLILLLLKINSCLMTREAGLLQNGPYKEIHHSFKVAVKEIILVNEPAFQ